MPQGYLTNTNQFKSVLRRNVIIPFVFIICLSASFVGLIFHLLSVNQWVQHTDVVLLESSSIGKLVDGSAMALRGYLLTGEAVYLDRYHKFVNPMQAKLNGLKELVADNPLQVVRSQKVETEFAKWLNYSEEVISLKRSNGNFLRLVNSGMGRALTESIEQTLQEFELTETNLRDERTRHSNQVTYQLVIITIALGVLIGALIAYFSRRQVFSLSRLFEAALQKQMELGESLQNRDWLKTGQGLLVDQLRVKQTPLQMCNRALRFICEYLDVQVGALFLNEGKEYFLVSTYATDPNWRTQNKTFSLENGLHGRAAVDMKFIHLKDVPENYMPSSSSLGTTSPREICIFPVISSDQVKAVIEIGKWNAFTERELEFLHLITEPLGSFIRSAQDKVQLENLLEETRRQAEALQSQQEELKTTNEELEEQAKMLKDSQFKLQSQQEELSRSNTQLEEQTQLLEDQQENLKWKNQELVESKSTLEKRGKELETANRYKSEFLANMSHELRTPLNSSLILLKLLMENKKQNLDAEQTNYLKTIHSSSYDLLNIINDILDLSRVEAGQLNIEAEAVSIPEIAQSLESMFRHAVETKGLKFQVEIDSNVPNTISSDRLRVEQILKNLISNAIKFTDTGEIRLRFFSSSELTASQQVGCAVTDTGIGIPKDKLGLIFEPFKQADGSINRKYGGTGLGLSISKELARLLGGTIEVRSEEGKGSTFSLFVSTHLSQSKEHSHTDSHTLRMKTHSETPIRKPPSFHLMDDRDFIKEGDRILLVIEDDPLFAKLMLQLSHSAKFKCLIANNADEGFDFAKKYLPTGIVLDLRLPDHHGLTVLDRLKSNPVTRSIPVHVVSASDERQSALKMGAVNFLQKPIDDDKLQNLLKQISHDSSRSLTRVLLVEDDTIQSEDVAKLLSNENVETTTIKTAEEALDRLRQDNFDCVIIDLKLSGTMSGEELLEKIPTENLSHIPPIIVYTARQITRAEEEKLLKLSRSIVIKGGQSSERLLNEVTLFLHKVENKLPPERQAVLRDLRSREKVLADRKILLADDDMRNLFALTSALEQKGAKVISARTGKEAIEKLRSHPDVDIVLMDIMMPEMDGYEATKAIRKMKNFDSVPIIVITAKAMQDDHDRAIDAGANDYLAKPIEVEKLLSLIRVWLPRGGSIVRETVRAV